MYEIIGRFTINFSNLFTLFIAGFAPISTCFLVIHCISAVDIYNRCSVKNVRPVRNVRLPLLRMREVMEDEAKKNVRSYVKSEVYKLF